MASPNSKTVNIGNWDEQTPIASGAGRTLLTVSGTASATGDIISAPAAGVKIVLVSVFLQNTTTTANTMLLKDGSGGAEKVRVLGQNQGDGLQKVYPIDARPKLTAATALNLNLSSATAVAYTIDYYTE